MAFRHAKPAQAWAQVQKLLILTKGCVQEAAQARYEKNFGTTMCDNCDGLKAGPDVEATCFQRKLCYFDNFKKGDVTQKQSKVIDRLLNLQSKS